MCAEKLYVCRRLLNCDFRASGDQVSKRNIRIQTVSLKSRLKSNVNKTEMTLAFNYPDATDVAALNTCALQARVKQ